ncbi:Ppx/GppA phosphatase family protein [Sediminivirga luteola]|uniref:Hydrolase n=1 Tax=Sediminivirga luteola TaxID=1774748 RepID=A0A8J2TZD3_9MICO|nr:exopolyphosphatase [Sediminivirga luteola]GGA18995.1 hydrolase [Sediminivirga luteola]
MTRVAAFDCGTNSLRLLIADIDADAGTATDVVRDMRIVRLGQGVDATGAFAPEALERAFAATEEFAAVVRREGAERIRFTATSATRDAANREVFLSGIEERLGVRPEVISGDEEAALSFDGATRGLTGAEAPYLVCDLGGGSTELVLGDDSGVAAAWSMDIGCVRLTERHTGREQITAEARAAALADIDAALDEAETHVSLSGVRTLVGVAGTVTTLTAHILRLDGYRPERIHGARLQAAQVTAAARELAEMTAGERAALPYMHPGRADVIATGALIYDRVVERLRDRAGEPAILTSERDILDGIAWSLS